jgi:hypothetical protein
MYVVNEVDEAKKVKVFFQDEWLAWYKMVIGDVAEFEQRKGVVETCIAWTKLGKIVEIIAHCYVDCITFN